MGNSIFFAFYKNNVTRLASEKKKSQRYTFVEKYRNMPITKYICWLTVL